mmetsp:Transcript_7562/g.17446  ORF Transcript_7562/g.17446 Transcript_7562/m.17446 type:complete len:249 (-) Transcript_7562:248-994(-)
MFERQVLNTLHDAEVGVLGEDERPWRRAVHLRDFDVRLLHTPLDLDSQVLEGLGHLVGCHWRHLPLHAHLLVAPLLQSRVRREKRHDSRDVLAILLEPGGLLEVQVFAGQCCSVRRVLQEEKLNPGRVQQLHPFSQRRIHDAILSTDGPFPRRPQSGVTEDRIEERRPVQQQPDPRFPLRRPLGCKTAEADGLCRRICVLPHKGLQPRDPHPARPPHGRPARKPPRASGGRPVHRRFRPHLQTPGIGP